MVYVYEGIEPEAPGSKRHRLINPHYFCGVYDGADNDKLWQEVYDYLDETYDLTKVKKVYLNADSGSWIQGAKKRLHGLTRVMDEFHLNKYLLRMTGGLLDSAGDARRELVHQIKKGTQEGFGHETEQKLTTECVENVIMMVPFSSVAMWTFGEKIGNGWKKILWCSGKIAFILSVSIEMLQLLLRLGTFQLSDIFYNTVGGVLGGLMYYIAMKARKRL